MRSFASGGGRSPHQRGPSRPRVVWGGAPARQPSGAFEEVISDSEDGQGQREPTAKYGRGFGVLQSSEYKRFPASPSGSAPLNARASR
nr:unnamed protein product [Digitaria exilis]